MLYHLYTDGGARGNPGPAGVGVVIQNGKSKTLDETCAFIGLTTNNQAEYRALILGLGRLLELADHPAKTEIHIHMDSELIVHQMNGLYKVKNKGLKPLHDKAKKLVGEFKKTTFSHILRAGNKRADWLVNQALDRHSK